MTGVYTGLRLADCTFLTPQQVNLKAGIITVTPVKTQYLRKEVVVPIHPGLRKQIRKRVAAAKKYIFPEAVELYELYPNAPGSALVQHIQDHFTDKVKLTVSMSVPNRKRAATVVGFHSLRHSFVTMAAEAGVDEPTLMNMVGHGSPAMTRIYNHISTERKRKAVESLPAV